MQLDRNPQHCFFPCPLCKDSVVFFFIKQYTNTYKDSHAHTHTHTHMRARTHSFCRNNTMKPIADHEMVKSIYQSFPLPLKIGVTQFSRVPLMTDKNANKISILFPMRCFKRIIPVLRLVSVNLSVICTQLEVSYRSFQRGCLQFGF